MTPHQSRVAEHTVDARRADGDDTGVEHHEREPAVAVQEMVGMKGKDRLLFPVFEPPVARDQCVVFVGQTAALLPVVELARSDPQPDKEPAAGDLGAFRPVADVVDDGVTDVVGNPGFSQRLSGNVFL